MRRCSIHYREVEPLIARTFQYAFTPDWVQTHLTNPTHELMILRHLIPWQRILERLVPHSHSQKGRLGHSLRLLVALSILSRLRHLSERQVLARIQENRDLQSFCNVPDAGLRTCLHPSPLCRFRQRMGKAGIAIIVFDRHCMRRPGRRFLMHQVVTWIDVDTPDLLKLILCIAFA